MIKKMKLMIPFTPHLALECLEKLKCKNTEEWPKINKNYKEKIKFAVQINGKTRDVISVDKDFEEEQVKKEIKENSKANKFLENKKIIKTIFVKGKIINYIINDQK